MAASAALARTNRLKPKGREYAAKFGSHPYDPARPELGGVEGDLKRKHVYHFPKPRDPVKLQRVQEDYVDMTAPWRRAEIERGAAAQADVPRVQVAGRHVPVEQAEQVGRKFHRRGSTFGYSPAYSTAPYWKDR